ncbi:MAG: TIGR02757 family protein [Planctomycetota bacterium]|jgi:uncharacterized protein (TIGR02757 family)
MGRGDPQIRNILERVYAKYNRRQFIGSDPLQFVYHYSAPEDAEIVGLLAAVLAYGRVQQIQGSLTDLLARMGESPRAFVKSFGLADRRKLDDFKHRFTTGGDISDLLVLLKHVLNNYGSIEAFLAQGYDSHQRNIVPALSSFCDSLLNLHAKRHNGSVPRGLSYLLPRPAAGSACKRLNLFLRWMVRDDTVDAGLWKTVDKAKLIVPVDVHMGRLCRILGLYEQKTVSLTAAVKITEGFARIEPHDPVKYDFALSRIGILDNCTGRHRKGCEFCELLEICRP